MESSSTSGIGLALIATVFVGFLAFRAWTQGALKMFWAISGLSLGAACGFFFFQNANAFISKYLPGRELSLQVTITCSVIIALVGWILFRILSKMLLKKFFGPDSALSGWSDGFRGSILSLVPSFLTVLLVGLCLRMGGTLLELKRAEVICHPESTLLTEEYPGWPYASSLRDDLESLPRVVDIYQVIDPVSRIPTRKLVLLLIASKNTMLHRHLSRHGSIGAVTNGAIYQGLLADEAVKDLLEEKKHVALLRHPMVTAVTGNEAFVSRIAPLDITGAIDEFMLSEERQKRLRSYQRPEVPEF